MPMPFAAHTTTSAGWKCSLPVGIEPRRPRRRSPGRRPRSVRTRAPVTSCAPAGDRARPVGDVGRSLRALVAARAARPALHARVAAVVVAPTGSRCTRATSANRGARVHGPARGRRVRSATVGAGDRHPAGTSGCRRARRPRTAGRSPRSRAQLLVRERPVVGDAVLGADAEVGRQQPGPHRAVEHGAATDAVEVAEDQVGVVEVDRVVGRLGRARSATTTTACGPAAPSRSPAPGSRRVLPVALLEAHHAEAGAGEPNAATPPDAPAPTIRTSARRSSLREARPRAGRRAPAS